MNCPFKKHPSRILSLIVVLTLLLGMLTGCLGGKDKDSDTNPSSDPNLNLVDPSDPSDSATEDTNPAGDGFAVVTQQVNVRSTCSNESGTTIGFLDPGTEVEIIRTQEANGIVWALIRQGWVPMDSLDTNYVPSDTQPEQTTPEETTPTETTAPETTNIKGVITASELTIRKEPSTDSEKVGSYQNSDVVTILETQNGWGRTSKGWISMQYVKTTADGTETGSGTGTGTGGSTTTTSTKGTVTAAELNIRKEASTTSEKVGSYKKGDTITILETSNGWGRTDKGWVSMKYVNTGSGTTSGGSTSGGTTTTTSGKKGVVIASELNIRKTASTSSDRVGSYAYGDRVTILETSGSWGRTDKGWISLDYVYQDGTTGSKSCKGIVTGSQLNIRSGPGTGYDKVAALNSGDRVNVLERITLDGTTWGCVSKGWICMDYVYVDGTTGTGSGTGTVTGDGLNIRSGPGTNYDRVGSLNKGDTVKILAQFTFGDATWGCTEKGWVSMKYVDMG